MPFFRRKSVDKTKAVTTKACKAPSAQLSTLPTLQSPGVDIGFSHNHLSNEKASRSNTVRLRHPPSPDALTGDLGVEWDSPLKTKSQLSKTLQEILQEKDGLPYFIQYMEHRGALQIIKFWLDADSFQASSLTRIRTQSLHDISKDTLRKYSSADIQKHNSAIEYRTSHDNIKSTEYSDDQTSQTRSTVTDTNIHQTHNALDIHTADNHTDSGITSDFSDKDSTESTNETQKSDKHVCNSTESCSHSERLVNSAITINSENKSAIALRNSGNPASSIHSVNSTCTNVQSVVDVSEKLRKNIECDAVSIYCKYLSLDATHAIGITEDLRNEATKKICQEDGEVDPACFQACQQFVVDVMEKEYFPDFLRSVFHSKHQVDVLTSGDVYLADVLYNETAMFYFMEFMEQERAMYLLQFYLTLDNFENHLYSLKGDQYQAQETQEDAMVLYEKYFSLQATNPLGFDDKVRFQVECNICRQEGPLPDCFATPKKIAFHTLEQDFFPAFLHSELYFKYLSELINTIQTDQVPNQTKSKRRGSDASSEHSVSSTSNDRTSAKNTLLAIDTSSKLAAKKALNKLKPSDMRIDTSSLNPESPLWLRSQASAMTIGHVTEIGQFVSEFSPEPDHDTKKKGRFSKKKKAKDKAQEDMAWQVAQMIIKDVNILTQQTCDTTNDDIT